ncbi:MAG: PDZ domain-containing protein [Lentisphaerae bacterium]|jgi:hypothetical protein|nr:PDZ domain-containing protein [Lentisphaerota bacterium]MBT4816104.1 PDZ domain-containing protein [Lentisphaerota bacterium]MBT5611287.1 PDZ domain-containing protein [Lentisphaerota bacterium]MBT7058396.1 PDZ domain-containing protein [Lentisphaerota bacterium]MBT7846831.1 PDZ domain-containing protein [Lentisphaerota bacterium]
MTRQSAAMLCAGALLLSGLSPVLAQDNAPPPGKIGYLGVAIQELPDSLRTHLSLPDGVGLLVAEVVPDSPAEKAGLRKHDIIHRLDDQIVVNPDQFRVLIRMMKPGDTVTITLVRKNRDMAVEAVLGETDDQLGANGFPGNPFGDVPRQLQFGAHGEAIQLPDIKIDADAIRRAVEEFQKSGQQRAKVLQEALQGTGPTVNKQVIEKNAPLRFRAIVTDTDGAVTPTVQTHTVTRTSNGNAMVVKGTASAVSSLSDGTHSITVTSDGNSRHVKATDANGKVIFDGPANTEAERQAMPAEIREKIGALEVRVNTIGTAATTTGKTF